MPHVLKYETVDEVGKMAKGDPSISYTQACRDLLKKWYAEGELGGLTIDDSTRKLLKDTLASFSV